VVFLLRRVADEYDDESAGFIRVYRYFVSPSGIANLYCHYVVNTARIAQAG
jgi:hypothetical protein